MDRSQILFLLIVSLFLIVIVGLQLNVFAEPVMSQSNTVNLTVHNSYRFDVKLEVKCDWSHEKRRFLYHKRLHIPGWKKTIIRVPNHHKECQVWPHVKLY